MSEITAIIPVFVPHRGCVHNCVFCDQKTISGQYEQVDDKYVDALIKKYLKTINSTDIYVAFYGGSFTAIPLKTQNMLMDAVIPYIKKGIVKGIRLSTRPDYINKEILDNLKNHYVKIIELGVQSMDDDVLYKSERGHTPEDVIYASRLISEYGFELGLQMMIGLPGDNKAKDLYTASEIIKLRPSFVRIYPTLIIKGTKLESMYKEGQYAPLSVLDAVNILSDVMLLFDICDITVIRVGLQVTESINYNAAVVAGPFHPSIRQLAENEIFFGMMSLLYEDCHKHNKTAQFRVNDKDMSNAIGISKKNIERFYRKYGVKPEVIPDKSISKSYIALVSNVGSCLMCKKLFAKRRNLYSFVEY